MCSSGVLAQGPPKPGPELEPLKKLVGTWDLAVQAGGQESKGTASCKMELGGLWLTADLKMEFFGQKFEQKGLMTYDASKKEYVGVLANSMSTAPWLMEGTFDETAKKMTATQKGTGPDGKPATLKHVMEQKDDDSFVQKIFAVDNDGKEQELMTLTYTRKKR